MSESKVSIRKRIFFSLPDIPIVFSSIMVSYYLLYFYTDVYMLPIHAIPGIFLLCQIFDAVNDCCCAYVMCRVRSKRGIYRPYILWTAIPLAITSVLMFTTPEFSENGKIVYVVLIYFLWNTTYTFLSVAKDALLPVMGKTDAERVTLNSTRIGLTILLMIICSSYLMPMVNFFGGGDQRLGFFLTIVVLSAIGLPIQILAYFKNKEPEQIVQKASAPFWKAFYYIIRDWGTLTIMLMFCTYWIGNTIRNQSIVYYTTYVINKPEYIPAFMTSSMCASFAMQFVFSKLLRVAKLSVLTIAGIFGAIVSTVLIWVSGDYFPMLLLSNILYGVTSAFPSNMVFIILAKRVDYLSETHGFNFGSLLYSFLSSFKRIGVGIGGALLTWILTLVGYVPNEAQSEIAVFGITFNFIWGTAIGLLLSGIFMMLYLKSENKTETP